METVTEMIPTEPLKPCPFCGGPSRLYVSELAGVPELEPSYYVECADCGGCGPGYDDVFKSERYWNNACNNDPTRSKVAADDSPRRFDPVRGDIGREERTMSDNWSAEYKAALINELNEVRELLAECQHGNDKLREEAAAHRKRANNLTRRVQELERLLDSLTPGGSEFSCDPEACARWVRERLGSVGKLALERNRYREQVARMITAFEKLREATFVGHGHWDAEGTHGTNCPACIQIRELRKEADELYREATNG